jgi:CheY-like chemotaxis protein
MSPRAEGGDLVAEVSGGARGFEPSSAPGRAEERAGEGCLSCGWELGVEVGPGVGTRAGLRVLMPGKGDMTEQGPREPIRVLLVEDQITFRCAVVSLLELEPDLEVVAEAGSLAQARSCVARLEFDVAILDLELPDGNGVELIGELHQANPDVAVVILSASLDPENVARANEAGADAVLDKLTTTRDQIVCTIRCLSGG